MTGRKLSTMAAVEAAQAAGMTRREAAAHIGVSLKTIYTYAHRLGVVFPKRSLVDAAHKARNDQIAALFRQGVVGEEIAAQHGISRERVRQILEKQYGLTGADGGKRVRGERNSQRRQAERDARYLAEHGCDYEQYVALSAGGARAPIRAYQQQRQNALRRGIGWELTLWQWWSIWQASGKWAERGRSPAAYGMGRVDIRKPFAPGNVVIAPGIENSATRNCKNKKSGLPLGVHRSQRGSSTRYWATRKLGGKQYYLGTFKTPELAHAAYLAAPSTIAERSTAA